MTSRGAVACFAAAFVLGCSTHDAQHDATNETPRKQGGGTAGIGSPKPGDDGAHHGNDPDATSGSGGPGGSGGAGGTSGQGSGGRGAGGSGGKSGSGGSSAGSGGKESSGTGGHGSGTGGESAHNDPCDDGQIPVPNTNKLDLLFMVDNSNSMREEQAALRTQFAHLIEVLTTGDRDADGVNDFPPARDLHLGVVSSDMGLLGVDGVESCSGYGRDGILQHAPSSDPALTDCETSYPTFLSYQVGKNDPATTAKDFACIATLGTGGCGFEQQLEAPLKALWPSLDPMPNPDGSNRIKFLGAPPDGYSLGHGDLENAGFLRNDPSSGLSVIAIIVVTDEEDCSSSNTHHFVPSPYLDPNDPLASQGLNLRCYYNQKDHNGDELYPVERYVNGFKALRPGNENLVVFAAIAGVPPDLVDQAHLSNVDFSDATQRDNFYTGLLNDSRMQETIDPASVTTPGTGSLVPSCTSATGKAFPPRRIVQVAQQFGENGIVQSICQQDFGPALDVVIDMIGKQLGAVCLSRSLTRDADGLVGCNVYWELPKAGQGASDAPTACGATGWEFLLDPGPGHAQQSDGGGAICKVAQLAVKQGGAGGLMPVPTLNAGTEFSQGWFYDDFSDEVKASCTGDTMQRIAFSAAAKPPKGAVVKLDCLGETESDSDAGTDACGAGSR